MGMLSGSWPGSQCISMLHFRHECEWGQATSNQMWATKTQQTTLVLALQTNLTCKLHHLMHTNGCGSAKSGPYPSVFSHFDLQMRFAPQRRAIFPDRNIQNSSRAEVFCIFWLANVLRATAACHFSFLCWTATSAPAALASLLFEHPEPRIIEKTERFATFLTFPNIWRVCIFFLVTLLACWSSFCWLDFSTLLFNCPYCRKLDF